MFSNCAETGVVAIQGGIAQLWGPCCPFVGANHCAEVGRVSKIERRRIINKKKRVLVLGSI